LTLTDDELIDRLFQCHDNVHSDVFSETVVELTLLAQDEPERAWRVVLAAIAANPPEDVLGLVGAVPLEDLMQSHGANFIDRVEAEAASNDKFRHLLNGIYRGDIDDATWQRIVRISGRPREMRS
jgi:hypothetical protein